MTASNLGTNAAIPSYRVDPRQQMLLDRVQVDRDMRSQFEAAMSAVTQSTAPMVLCMYEPVEALQIFALTGDKTRFALKQWSVHLHKLLKGRITYVGARELLVHCIGYDCYHTAKQQENNYVYVNTHGPSRLNTHFTLSDAALEWFVKKDVKL